MADQPLLDQHYLEVGGVGLLVDLTGGAPVVVHGGAPLGEHVPDAGVFATAVPHSMFDAPIRPSVLPQLSRGWRGRPAVRGSRGGQAFAPLLALTGIEEAEGALTLRLADALARSPASRCRSAWRSSRPVCC